jgi:uncharacterized glyoxalase superfamily protein PhnB
MKQLPDGWPRISASLYYDDARAAIDWLCKVFGFELRLLVEGGDGSVMHCELVFGEGVIMIAQSGARPHYRSPKQAGGNTMALMVMVDDVEAHCKKARELGAVIAAEPTTNDYGDDYWTDRSYRVVDCGGHHWWFTQRIRTGNPEYGKVRNKVDRSHHEK